MASSLRSAPVAALLGLLVATHSRCTDARIVNAELAGCEEVRAGPVCHVAQKTSLVLWVEASESAELTLSAEDATLDVKPDRIQDGWRYVLGAPAGRRELSVRVREGRSTSRKSFILAHSVAVPELDRAQTLRRSGSFAEAEAVLQSLDDSIDPIIAAKVAGMRARIALAQGQSEEAVAGLERAVELDRAAGLISDEASDRFTLAYALNSGPRAFEDAKRALEATFELSVAYPEGLALADHFRAIIDSGTGDLRGALDAVHGARRHADRLQMTEVRNATSMMLARLLQKVGRYSESVEVVAELHHQALPSGGACGRALLYNNLGDLTQAARFAGARSALSLPDPVTLIEKAAELYRKECPNPAFYGQALLGLIESDLAEGRVTRARVLLEEVKSVSVDLHSAAAAERIDFEGRVELAEGNAQAALTRYEQMERLATRGGFPAAEWQATLGRALALESLGRANEAIEAFGRTERLLDAQSRMIPFGEGQFTFLSRHDSSARAALELLLRADRKSDAFELARRSRARLMARLDASTRVARLPTERRERWYAALDRYRQARARANERAAGEWSLTGAELEEAKAKRRAADAAVRAALDESLTALGYVSGDEEAQGSLTVTSQPELMPGEGEVVLLYHPLRSGWVGFARSRDTLMAEPLPEIDPTASPAVLSDALLLPFAALIAPAKRVRVLVFGDLEHVDFQELPWGQGTLMHDRSVVYGQDLQPAPHSGGSDSMRALLVIDPRRDLAAAREEGRRARSALEARGYSVTSLEGDAATVQAVLQGLESTHFAIFHYAGHGLFAGPDGSRGGLAMAGNAWISAGDLLSLPSAPRVVILSGCETAQSRNEESAGLSIGQSFLLAGSSVVVAAQRQVDDNLALEVISDLYTAPIADDSNAIADHLRVALVQANGDQGSNASSFRVMVR